MRKVLGLIPAVLAFTQQWWWEFVRAALYEKILHQVEGSVSWEWTLRYGSLAFLILLVLWLFWPELQERIPGLARQLIPIDEAANRAYEAAVKADTLEFVSKGGLNQRTGSTISGTCS